MTWTDPEGPIPSPVPNFKICGPCSSMRHAIVACTVHRPDGPCRMPRAHVDLPGYPLQASREASARRRTNFQHRNSVCSGPFRNLPNGQIPSTVCTVPGHPRLGAACGCSPHLNPWGKSADLSSLSIAPTQRVGGSAVRDRLCSPSRCGITNEGVVMAWHVVQGRQPSGPAWEMKKFVLATQRDHSVSRASFLLLAASSYCCVPVPDVLH